MSKDYAIGIDLGGTNVKMGLVKKGSRILKRKVLNTGDYPSRRALIKAMIDTSGDFLRSSKLKANQVAGIGVGVPGPVNFEEGIIYTLTNIKGWNNVELEKIFEEKLKIKTYLDNDVNVIAVGEHIYGAGTGVDNLICITLGTGVGGALIINGKIYRGANFVAGEIGHVPINIKGPVCACGAVACLERYVGNRYIVERAKRAARRKKKSLLSKLVKGDMSKITPELITKAARKNDSLARSIWQEAGLYIGTALSGVVNLLNPEMIIIGGGISKAGNVLLEPIRQTVKKRSMASSLKGLKIVSARLGEDAGLIGAATLATLGKDA